MMLMEESLASFSSCQRKRRSVTFAQTLKLVEVLEDRLVTVALFFSCETEQRTFTLYLVKGYPRNVAQKSRRDKPHRLLKTLRVELTSRRSNALD